VLTPEELSTLEATLLPAVERHHLRLLAHGLRTLQAIAGGRDADPPDGERIRLWVLEQAATAEDPAFAAAFARELMAMADQLRRIAGPARPALSLDLPELVTWSRRQADSRLNGGEGAGSGTPPDPPAP
jgi:hypothetical protein